MAVQGTDYEILLKLRADIAQAVNQLNSVQAELRKTSDSAIGAGGGMNTMGAETGDLIAKLKALPGLTNKIQVGFHDLRNILIGAFAIHEVANFTGALVNANVEAQRIQFTLQQAFGEQGAKQQFQFVIDLSKKLGLSLQDAAQGYAQLAASAQGTGLQTADLQKLFIGLSQAATVFHLSGADVNGTLTQLSQGLSLGKLHMQDLKAIAQHLPGTMTAITEAVNKMGLSLDDALKEGIPAVQLIGNLGDVLQQRFAKQSEEASHSLNGEIQKLKTTLFEATTQGNDFATAMANAFRSLNDALDEPAIRTGFADIITALGTIAGWAIKATGEVSKFFSEIAQGIGVSLAELQNGGVLPDDQLGNTRRELQGINTELKQLQQYASQLSKPSGERAAVSDDVVRRMLGLDYQTQITPQLIQQAIAKRELIQKNLQDAEKRLESGKTGGPIVAPKPSKALAPILGGTPKPVAGADEAAAAAAAKTARDAAAAQQQLAQSLIDLQGQLDPTAAIYAKYNAAVQKATEEADLAKKAHGANAQAIEAQKQAVIDLAGKVRDAALDQLAEKDRQAWEALRRSFETPAEVRVDDALKQIAQLNDMLKNGVIDAQQYHDALGQVGQKSVAGALPTYQGIDAAVGGPYSELQKNYQAQTSLDAAYQAQKLALNKKFNDENEAQHAAHVAALSKLDEDYKTKSTQIEKARGSLQLDAASNLFGQLAQLSTSHNKKMAAIGKAAAIAQAVIETYKSANEAYSALALIPYIGPALGAAAAGVAIAAGLANVAQIRAQSVGGYATGGYTGNAPVTQAVGVVHGREGVLSAPEVQAIGGEAGFNALRRAIGIGYADGGYVAPFAGAPSPAALGFRLRATPNVSMPAPSAAGGAERRVVEHHYHVFNEAELAERIAAQPATEKAVVHIVGEHPRAIQGKWGSG